MCFSELCWPVVGKGYKAVAGPRVWSKHYEQWRRPSRFLFGWPRRFSRQRAQCTFSDRFGGFIVDHPAESVANLTFLSWRICTYGWLRPARLVAVSLRIPTESSLLRVC